MGFFQRAETTSLAAAGTFYGTAWIVTNYDKVAFQWDTFKFGSAAAKCYIQLRASKTASWTELQISGSDFEHALTGATGVIDSTGKLTFTAVSTLTSGNEVKVVLEDTATAGAETVAVVVATPVRPDQDGMPFFYPSILITVGIEAGVSTAAQVKTALDGDATAASFISTAVTTAAAMGVGEVTLTNGSFIYDIETGCYEVRTKLVVTTGSTGASLQSFVCAKT
jgi:hypothetical protein